MLWSSAQGAYLESSPWLDTKVNTERRLWQEAWFFQGKWCNHWQNTGTAMESRKNTARDKSNRRRNLCLISQMSSVPDIKEFSPEVRRGALQ